MRFRLLAVLAVVLTAACEHLPDDFDIGEENADSKAAQLVRVADTTRDGGDLINAAVLYRRAAQMRPDWPAPTMGLADTAYALGEYAAARDAYARVADMGDAEAETAADAAVGLGRALLRLGAADDALAAFDRAPDDPRAVGGGAVALDLLGRNSEAQIRYAEGVAAFPDNAALRTNQGFSLALAGDYDAAVAVLDQAQALSGAGPRTRQNLALVYGLKGDAEAARALLAVDLDAAAVANNLLVYESLRALAPDARARAVFGLGGVGGNG
jgi:tetratricopeptide (TPR) repeat protein